jgi:hypothetical protein
VELRDGYYWLNRQRKGITLPLTFNSPAVEQSAQRLWEDLWLEEPKRIQAVGMLDTRANGEYFLLVTSIRRAPEPDAELAPEPKFFLGHLDPRPAGLYLRVPTGGHPPTSREFRLVLPARCLPFARDRIADSAKALWLTNVVGRFHRDAATGETFFMVDAIVGAPNPGEDVLKPPPTEDFLGHVEEKVGGFRFTTPARPGEHRLILPERQAKALKSRLNKASLFWVEGQRYYDAFTNTPFLKVEEITVP